MKVQFVLICFLISIATAVAQSPQTWAPIKDLKDQTVVEIANFAINEHNKNASTNLKLETIESGESRYFMGMNYRLLLVVNEGASKNKYDTFVWDDVATKLKNLVSFKRHN
ncbi:Cysteine proteinase inhibitor [Euphorbia peplus]|nr:Cysteine proteinase inhibitor [Euphorbia peplus]